MSNKYSVKEFHEFIEYVHDNVEGVCIGTDVIVGFPGETEHLFNETFEYLNRSCLDYIHVFSYSGTTVCEK